MCVCVSPRNSTKTCMRVCVCVCARVCSTYSVRTVCRRGSTVSAPVQCAEPTLLTLRSGEMAPPTLTSRSTKHTPHFIFLMLTVLGSKNVLHSAVGSVTPQNQFTVKYFRSKLDFENDVKCFTV